MLQQLATKEAFSVGEARRIVQDLFEPKAWIYWADLLGTMAVGTYALLGSLLLGRSGWSPWLVWGLRAPLYAVACIAYYRGVLFTHELVHLRKGSFQLFRAVWNLICGIPFLIPSFTYHTHVAHHMRRHYGTPEDGEYLPLASGPRWRILWYLSQSFVLPLLAVIRFGVLTPLCWISPGLRRWVQRRASSMVIDPSYVRPLPTAEEWKIWRLQEAACLLGLLAVAGLVLFGLVQVQFVVHIYFVAVGVLMLNAVRTLGAHRYRNRGGEMTFVGQLVDSVNYPKHPFTSELWAPVGLRFHALHHLFPSLPYHNLAKAHRRLMAELPADSPYRLTESPSLWASVKNLWSEAQGMPAHGRARERELQAVS